MKSLPIFVLLLGLFHLTGCVSYQPLQLEPVRKATPVAPRFTDSFYFFDRDRNLYFVMRAVNTDSATGKQVVQVATIRVFWHPKGGVTTLNPTALNATFRYLVMTPDAVGMYEGAGFVLLNSNDGDRTFEAHVVDGDMRLTQASTSFNDTLGRAHIHGYFAANYNDARAVDMLLDAHREFFARSLALKPTTAPATSTAPAPRSNVTPPDNWGIPSSILPPLTTSPATAP